MRCVGKPVCCFLTTKSRWNKPLRAMNRDGSLLAPVAHSFRTLCPDGTAGDHTAEYRAATYPALVAITTRLTSTYCANSSPTTCENTC